MAQITLNQPIAEIHGVLSKPRPLFFESVCSFSQITFGYLSYYPATCFVFASGLANIPAFTLYTLHATPKKSPSKAIFLAQSKIIHYLCNRLGKAIPITTYFSIAL